MRARRGRLAGADRRPDPAPLRLRERAHGRARRQAQPAADGRLPRPGFVEGTWSLECLLDKLAAQLGVDPLELRRRNHTEVDAMDGRPFSSKQLLECTAGRAALGAGIEVRARSDEVWKRGMGLASQIWYGGGGPPSYAWVRLGSDGRVNVVTAMQDIGRHLTAMAQIAAEELGLPLDRVRVQVGDSRPWAVRVDLRRLLDAALDGPGGALRRRRRRSPGARAGGAALRSRRVDPEPARRRDRLRGRQHLGAAEITGLLDDGQILGKGARGPNPAGMRVLTFGIQLAEAVDVGTGRWWSRRSSRSTTSAA